jgi:hypothetical protein
MIKYAYASWRRGKGEDFTGAEDDDFPPGLRDDALDKQLDERMRHYWESRMLRIYSCLGMPMKSKAKNADEVLATYRSYEKAGGVIKEVSFLIHQIYGVDQNFDIYCLFYTLYKHCLYYLRLF